MSETAVVQVAEVKQGATGTSDRGQWTRYDLLDGNGERFATFSKSVYESALPFTGKRAEVEYASTEKGRKLIAVREAAEQNGDTPPLGTGEYVTGQKPPIEARRIFASTAANNATRLTEILIAHQTSRDITPELVRAAWDAMCSHIFLDLLRKGEVMQDSDIPF